MIELTVYKCSICGREERTPDEIKKCERAHTSFRRFLNLLKIGDIITDGFKAGFVEEICIDNGANSDSLLYFCPNGDYGEYRRMLCRDYHDVYYRRKYRVITAKDKAEIRKFVQATIDGIHADLRERLTQMNKNVMERIKDLYSREGILPDGVDLEETIARETDRLDKLLDHERMVTYRLYEKGGR